MKQSTSLAVITLLLILCAALSVVMIYPQSFSPLIAIGLFSGAVIKDRKFSLIIPVVAAVLTALVFKLSGKAPGFYGPAQLVDFGIYALIALVGSFLLKRNILNIFLFTVLSCVVFYLVSNTAYFLITNPQYHTYPQTFSGYIANMTGALFFMRMTVISTGCYAALFFGVYALSERYVGAKQLV